MTVRIVQNCVPGPVAHEYVGGEPEGRILDLSLVDAATKVTITVPPELPSMGEDVTLNARYSTVESLIVT